MPITTRIRAVRNGLENRRDERVARRRLRNELASFQSPAERTELDALLGRYSAEETREIRAIINRQDYERVRRATVLGGNRVA